MEAQISLWTKFFLGIAFIAIGVVCFCVFFDQAILNRRETIFRGPHQRKRVAITFDDGPSPLWTPPILDELRRANIKATFFMIGHHVKSYPKIARRVAEEGHLIGNHGFAHSVTLYFTPAEIEEEIKYTEYVIKEITGQITRYYRPPKAWMSRVIKKKINSMGYEVILWSLNPKDWVGYPHQWMVNFLSRNIKNGDIILFHDSGNVFSTEGGDRTQTVLTIAHLAEVLKNKGIECVTVEELLHA